MYKIIVESNVTVTEEVEVITEYGDYYDSYTDEVDDIYLLKQLEDTVEDNLVEYVDVNLQKKLTDSSLSRLLLKDNKLVINSEFDVIKRLTKQELEQLKQNVSAQYSDGFFENGLKRNLWNGKKHKDYYLSIDWNTITIKQTKINA